MTSPAAPPAKPDTNPLRSFQERNVRLFFGGLLVSNMGTWLHTTAAILLVRDLGGSGLELGIVTACQFLPLLLFGLYAGAYADRRDRYRLTFLLQIGMGAVALGLGLVVLAGGASINVVYLFTAVLGLLSAFDSPARRTLSTELVPPAQMANILALGTSVMTGSRIGGPVLAVATITRLGFGWAFAINGLSFLIVLVAMAAMDRSTFHPLDRQPPSGTPIRDALNEVWAKTGLRYILVGYIVVATFTYNFLVGLPLLVEDRLDADPSLFGWLLSAMSIGSVIGSLIAARLTEASPRFIFSWAGVLGVSLAAISLSTSIPLSFALVIALGIGGTTVVNGVTIHVQQNTNPALRGRILALVSVIFLGSTPIGGPVTGAIGDAFGGLWANLYGGIAALGFAAGGALILSRRSAVPPHALVR